jgi:hypothetical protein
VSQPQPLFGDWLAERIHEAGYRSPSGFATAAGLQPSMVLRWINGKVQPTPEALVKAAAPLRVRVTEMLARGLDIPELEQHHELHPIAVRVNRLLTDHDLVPEDEQRMLETMLDRLITPPERKYYRIVNVTWGPGSVRDQIATSSTYTDEQKKALLAEADRLSPPDR